MLVWPPSERHGFCRSRSVCSRRLVQGGHSGIVTASRTVTVPLLFSSQRISHDYRSRAPCRAASRIGCKLYLPRTAKLPGMGRRLANHRQAWPGYDGRDGYLLYAHATPRRWTSIKQSLAFCKLSQDGDDEGILYLDRLPKEDEAEAIRDALGLRKRRHMTEAQIERSRSVLASARSLINRGSYAAGSI